MRSGQLTRIVFLVQTVGAADGDVVRAPRELLDVRAKVSQRHGAAVKRNVRACHVRHGLEVLVRLGKRVRVLHQIAQCH